MIAKRAYRWDADATLKVARKALVGGQLVAVRMTGRWATTYDNLSKKLAQAGCSFVKDAVYSTVAVRVR